MSNLNETLRTIFLLLEQHQDLLLSLQIGEILITSEKVIVPFKKEVQLIEPKNWLAIDINETNVTGISSDGNWFIIDTSEVKRIRHVYFEKRRKIQRY